jgi:hypothetical protein
VLWLPAFALMRESAFVAREHRPPAHVTRRGIPLFFGEPARALASATGEATVPPLCSDELVFAMQWTAPATVLGTFPGAPAVRESEVLAVDAGERDAVLRELGDLVSRAATTSGPVSIRPVGENDRRVELYLDGSGHQTWSPAARVDGELRLYCEGLGVIVSGAA